MSGKRIGAHLPVSAGLHVRVVPDPSEAPVADEDDAVSSEDHVAALRRAAASPNREEAKERISNLTTHLVATTGTGLRLADADLAGLDLAGFDLRSAVLNRARLHSTRLADANLSSASLVCPGMERTDLSRACLRGAYVHALSAQVSNFQDADLSELIDATGAMFHGCNLARTNLDSSVLAGTVFYQCSLEGASFARTNLSGATINECLLDGASFDDARVGQLTITKCHLLRTRFVRASGRGMVIQRPTSCDELDLSDAELPSLRCDGLRGTSLNAERLRAPEGDFLACSLVNARFSSAVLDVARFHKCSFVVSSFEGASLEAASIVSCHFPTTSLVDAAAENIRFVESQLPGADLKRFTARCASFRDCDLSDVDMRGAYLYRAVLTGDPPRAMSMRRVNAEGANLVQSYVAADLGESKLTSTNFTYARLNQCSFDGAALCGVLLHGASLVKVDLRGADVAGVRAPFYADRCPGLKQAFETAGAAPETKRFLDSLEGLLRDCSRGST